MADCYVWDFTLKFNEETNLNILKDSLRKKCKKWAFQLECSENGYKHYQGRISLIKRKALKPLLKLFGTPEWAGIHFSPTSSDCKGDIFYCTKDDTRIDGPWLDTDIEIIETEQMKLFEKWGLLPWQEKLKNETNSFCLRSIDLVYDPTGNAGKSLFSEFLETQGIAEEVPPFRLMDDIFQWVATRPIKKTYIVDMPRGMKKDKLGDFYSGIEIIKNGVAYDKRYNAKKIRFDRPRIIVFTNMLPALDLMSADRWKIWTIKSYFLLH